MESSRTPYVCSDTAQGRFTRVAHFEISTIAATIGLSRVVSKAAKKWPKPCFCSYCTRFSVPGAPTDTNTRNTPTDVVAACVVGTQMFMYVVNNTCTRYHVLHVCICGIIPILCWVYRLVYVDRFCHDEVLYLYMYQHVRVYGPYYQRLSQPPWCPAGIAAGARVAAPGGTCDQQCASADMSDTGNVELCCSACLCAAGDSGLRHIRPRTFEKIEAFGSEAPGVGAKFPALSLGRARCTAAIALCQRKGCLLKLHMYHEKKTSRKRMVRRYPINQRQSTLRQVPEPVMHLQHAGHLTATTALHPSLLGHCLPQLE